MLMVQMGLKNRQIKAHKYKHANKGHKTHDNILARNFSPTVPNQVWIGDVTYIRIKSGWCYLAVVLDLYARRMVGFNVSDSPDSMLTAKAYRWRITPNCHWHAISF
jgi:putative transposase